MNIVFDNYAPHQIVHTPIVILKGTIVAKGEDKDPSSTVQINGDTVHVHLHNNNQTTSSSSLTRIPLKIIQDKFVLVAQLSPGDNVLIFRYNETEVGRIQLVLQDSAGSSSTPPKYYVQSIIVHCSDSMHEQTYIDSIRLKISLGINLAQTIFSELLHSYKGRKSFHVHNSHPCEVVKLRLTRQELLGRCGTHELWEYLARQIKATPTLWSSKCKYVAFVVDPWKSVVDHGHAKKDGTEGKDNGVDIDIDSDSSMQHMQGLGGGGLALLDAKWLEMWPSHWTQVLGCIWDQKEGEALGSTMRSSYPKSLGSLIHEMGHIFDLGHSDMGVMGSQYDQCNLMFTPRATGTGQSTKESKDPSVICLDTGIITKHTFSLTASSTTILHYHRWFGSLHPLASGADVSKGISFESRNIIRSAAWPLTTIELRDPATGLVIKSWVLETDDEEEAESVESVTNTNHNPKQLTFSIRRRSIPVTYQTQQVELIAQNQCGNIFKETIDCRKLPESFTDIKRQRGGEY